MRHLPILPSERHIERRQDAEYMVLAKPENGQASHFSDYIPDLEEKEVVDTHPFLSRYVPGRGPDGVRKPCVSGNGNSLNR